jgi:hypothetical protein
VRGLASTAELKGYAGSRLHQAERRKAPADRLALKRDWGNPSDGILGALETSGSCEARSTPLPYPIGVEAKAAASARMHEDSRGLSS